MKTLILLRHAHRDTSKGRLLDNGLSPNGKKQARKFARYYLSQYPKDKPLILSSPAKRCVQTVRRLAKKTGTRVQLAKDLAERGMGFEGESLQAYIRRVHRFCKRVKTEKTDVVILCSHGDWLPTALKFITKKRREIKKGRWVEVGTRV